MATPTRSCWRCCEATIATGSRSSSGSGTPPAESTRSKRRPCTPRIAELLKDGLIEAYWGDESQGGWRKYYRITDASRAVHRRNVAAWALTRDLIDTLLELDRNAGRQSS
nr:hypothetical protein GCM10020092_078180 [Actinoplanes digitatis]